MLIAEVRPYFETHPIGILWAVVALATFAIELSGVGRRRDEATRRDGGSRLVLRACAVAAVLVLVWSLHDVRSAEIRPPLVFSILGVVLLAAGESLRVWCKVALGRYFTYTVMTSSDQPVVTSGPYRVLRHPSYSGLLLMTVGAGFGWDNWVGVAGLVTATLVGILYRIHVEEKALTAELGDRYRTYAEHHKRLIPFVW